MCAVLLWLHAKAHIAVPGTVSAVSALAIVFSVLSLLASLRHWCMKAYCLDVKDLLSQDDLNALNVGTPIPVVVERI